MKKEIKIILDLCGGTGAWSKPYKDAGYDVRIITLPGHNVIDYIPPKDVYGILAAPPCTMFSFARTNAKKPRDLKQGMEIVIACLNIIWKCQYRLNSDLQKYPSIKFWVLENPNGMLKWFLGNPVFTFHPWEFGGNYKKNTYLWGYFNAPRKFFKNCNEIMTKQEIDRCKTNSRKLLKFDKLKTKEIHGEFYGIYNRTARRAITPTGFAQAFFEANK